MNTTDIKTHPFRGDKQGIKLEIIDIQKILSMKSKSHVAHRLDFFQILIITKGVGIHEVDFTQYHYQANTVIPVAMGQVQRFFPNNELEGYAIVFTPDFLIKESFDYNYLFQFTIFMNNTEDLLCEATQSVKNILNTLIREQQESDLFESEALQRNLIRNFLIHLERDKRKTQNIDNKQKLDLYLRFRQEVETSLSYKLKIHQISEQLGVTSKQLNRVVKHYLGMTAKKYIDQRVLLESRRLLTHSSLSIKEIAYTIGFTDPTNFTKYFKSKFGMNPSDYRNKI
ncbi:AraC family transcriptional regulator [Halosquirtibacter laminarini]|uniref:AraC family transcriptional regulator n=1 Tax=Halosquirtibacter laminarini TaxID=3374600 RepID=A0AC61NPX0_9BACT|nr:AraC family transcriptional regulator [Prolixibacteraceae bacterium]